ERDDGRLDAAITAMRRAHDLAPQDAQTTALLGAYLTERGAAVDAVALLAPAAANERADLQVLVALAIAQARSGRGGDAVATLERAVAAHPANGMLLVDLGTIELMTGKRDEARRSFQAAIAANDELPRAHSSIAGM